MATEYILFLMKTPNAAASARILVLVTTGTPLPQAVDAVLGAGTYAKLASDLYDGLRAAK